MFNFASPDRRKEEERIRNEGRLPPGQSLTQKFPVLHYGPVPPFNPATWDFRVWGEVEQEARLDMGRVQPAAAHESCDGHPLRDALEQVRHALGGRFGADAGRAGAASRSSRRRSTSCSMPNTVSPSTCRWRWSCRRTSCWPPISTASRSRPTTAIPLRGVVGAIPRADRAGDALFLEGRQVAARAGVHAPGPARVLGTGRLHNSADVWKEERFA